MSSNLKNSKIKPIIKAQTVNFHPKIIVIPNAHRIKIMKSIFKTFFLSLCIIANVSLSYAQTASLLPNAVQQFFDSNGKPLTSGQVFFYVPNTTTLKTTWRDSGQVTPNTNPVILNAAGRNTNDFGIYGSGDYRQVVKDRQGNLIWDRVTSSTGSGGGSSPTATGDGDLVGTIKPWAGLTAPNQYVFTYGQELSRTTFAALFNAITSTQAVFCNSGSPALTGLADTTSFWIGMQVETSCVVSGNSTVISKTSNTVTLAVNANVSTNSNALFLPWGGGNHTTTFNVPDFRGFAIAGNNNMGGVASSILTTQFFGSTNPNSIGSPGGQQSVSLGATNLPPYTPTGLITNGAITITGVASNNTNGGTSDVTAGSLLGSYGVASLGATQATSIFTGVATSGASVPFSNVSPVKTSNYIIKTTPDTNSATASGVTSIGGMTGDIACGSGLLCTGNIITVNIPTPIVPLYYATSAGVTCDGTTDDTSAMQTAINTAQGRTIYMPAGVCKITAQLVAELANGQTFQPGVSIQGNGAWGSTVFDTRIANDCMLLARGTADNFFAAGITLKDIKITSLASTVGACGVEFYRVAYAKMDNVWMQNLRGDGFFLPASAGDADASFAVVFDRVRMDAVATDASKWCANFFGPTGGWALSNLRMTNSNFSGCGHSGDLAVPPVSGAVRIKVLTMQLENTTFTLNNNSDLYFQGPDTSSTITIDGADFENMNSTVLPHIYVDGGLRSFKFLNSECLNNDAHITAGCIWFNTIGIVGGVTIDGVKVRATTANTPYTAFQVSGSNGVTNTITPNNIWWNDFDHAGQIRFSGFTFAPIFGAAFFSISAVNTGRLIPVGYGSCIPIKMAATGEWVCYQVPSAGVTTAALGSATPTTSYNFYAYNSAALSFPITIAIERSTTATALDTTSGYFVKSGDSTRTFIGTAISDGAGSFQIAATQTSWYPPALSSGGGGAPSGPAGGDLTGTYPNPTLAAIGSATGPLGSATVAPIVTIDAKGRVTALTSATVTPAVASITGLGAGCATWLATPSSANLRGCVNDETGTGLAYFQNGALGTPTSGTLTSATGLPISTGLTGGGTGVLTALAVNIGTAGSFIVNGGVLGTPSSGVATNLTGTAAGLTAGTVTTNANLTGMVTSVGNAAVLGSFSSANLATALTNETGTGVAVFSGSPTITGLLNVSNNTPIFPVASGAIQRNVAADGTVNRFAMEAYGTGVATAFNAINMRRANGTGASNTAVQSGDLLYGVLGTGYGDTTFLDAAGSGITGWACQTFTNSAACTELVLNVTPTSTTTNVEAIRILNAGNVKFTAAANFSANSTVATLLGSLGPVGAHTTVQKWLTIVDNTGATLYVPAF